MRAVSRVHLAVASALAFAVASGGLAYALLASSYAATGVRPTAPASRAFGVAVGRDDRTVVERELIGRGLHCEDASMATIMRKARAQVAAKRAAAAPDAVASASWSKAGKAGKPSAKRPDSPQIRLACGTVLTATLPERPLVERGRLLVIFDDAGAPARSVSLQRTYPDAARGLLDANLAAFDSLARYGTPTDGHGIWPREIGELARLSTLSREWQVGAARMKLTVLDLGPRGVVVTEELALPYAPDLAGSPMIVAQPPAP